MMEIVNNIKDFVSYYNALVKEIERITPLKKGIESVLKSDCDCVYYENKEIDVVDVDRQISEMPQLPPLQEVLERKRQFEADCDEMILSGEDFLFRSLLWLFKKLRYYPTDLQFIDKELYDAKIIVDVTLNLGVHVIGNYESSYGFFDAIEERREVLMKDSRGSEQKGVGQDETEFPKELNIGNAIELFHKAIEVGLIELIDGKYHWTRSNVLLAYFCGKIYCGDSFDIDPTTKEYVIKRGSAFFPETAICSLFGLKNLGQSRLQIERLPKGYEEIDRLFKII